jgi:site-specific recombinase XerD
MDFSNLRRTIREICQQANVEPISPNELRHSAATLLIESGASMQEVADMFGHQDTRMLAMHYRHKRGVIDVSEHQTRMLG